MLPVDQLHRLQDKREGLLSGLMAFKGFRQGSLVERYRKCGKPSCHCARSGAKGHGPSWSLTRAIGGKTVTKIIPASAVEQTKEQIAEYHRFQRVVDELVETNVLICDTLLELPADSHSAAPNAVAAEKGGSRRTSRKR
jgi:hypothetical protein